MDPDRSCRALRLARALSLVVVASTPGLGAQSVRLNGPLPQPRAGSVTKYAISPDGTRVVYCADQVHDGVFEALSAPIDGSAEAVWLNAPLEFGLLAVGDFAIGAGGRVVLLGDLRVNSTYELYTVPIDGSAPPELLSGTMISSADVASFQLTPDGTRVVFRANAFAQNDYELFSVPVDGSSARARLDPLGRQAQLLYRISPTSEHVVFSTPFGSREHLLVVPVDASAPPMLLADSGESEVGFNTFFEDVRIASDGLHAAYIHVDAFLDRGDIREAGLFGLTLDGSQPPAQLHILRHQFTLPSYATVGSRVVYTEPGGELYTIESDGTGRVLLGTSAGEFAIAPDESQVAFLSGTIGASTLYAAPVDGSSPAVALAGPGALESPRFSSDSSLVLFIATVPSTTFRGLFAVPVEGGKPLLLNGPVLAGERGVLDFAVSPQGSAVVYRDDRITDDRVELFSVGLDLVTHQLSGPMPDTGDVFDYRIASDGHVVYRADQNSESCLEIFGAPIDGSTPFVQYNLPMPIGPVQGDVIGFRTTPDEERVIYLASQEIAGLFELYSAASDGQGDPTRLTEPLNAGPGDVFDDFVLSSSGETVVFRFGSTTGNNRLYACSSAGGEAVLLDTDTAGFEAPYLLDPGEAFVLYRAKSPDVLRRAELDGSTAFTLASPAFPGDIEFQLTPDGNALIYTAEQDVLDRHDLYRVPSTGGASLRLNAPSSSFSDVFSFRLIPDGSRVVYHGKQQGGVIELFSVPSDGSGPPAKLNGPLALSGSVHAFSITALGVLYNAQQTSPNRLELFFAPFAGDTPARRLNELVPGRKVFDDFTASSDGTLAFYRADATTVGTAELFVVPTDASASPLQLSAMLPPGGDVASFVLSSDQSRIVYLADQRLDEIFELFSMPATGGPALSLMTLPVFADVTTYRIDPGLQYVVYLADAVRDETFDLWRAPLDASAPPRRVNTRLAAGGDVENDFVPLTGGDVVYRADQETDGVLELFRSLVVELGAPLAPAAEPTRTRSVVR